MAGLFFTLAPGAVAIASATAKTALQIVAASNHRTLLHAISLGGNGVTAADPPAKVALLIQTTAGTMSSLTPAKENAGDDETIQTTAQHTATVEPTDSTEKWSDYLHMQTATGVIKFVPPLVIPGGTRLALKVTPGTMTGCNVIPWARCEE